MSTDQSIVFCHVTGTRDIYFWPQQKPQSTNLWKSYYISEFVRFDKDFGIMN